LPPVNTGDLFLNYLHRSGDHLWFFDLRRSIVRTVEAGRLRMDDLWMVVLIGLLFLAAWGLARFCERLSGRGRS